MRKAKDPAALKAALAERDLTHREMAAIVGCTRGVVASIVAGYSVNDEHARRFARALRRPVEALFAASSSNAEQTTEQNEAVA